MLHHATENSAEQRTAWVAAVEGQWVAWIRFDVLPLSSVVTLTDGKFTKRRIKIRSGEIRFRNFVVAPVTVIRSLDGTDVLVHPDMIEQDDTAVMGRVDGDSEGPVTRTFFDDQGDPPARLFELGTGLARREASTHVSDLIASTAPWNERRYKVHPVRPRRIGEDDRRDAEISRHLVNTYNEFGRGMWAEPFKSRIGQPAVRHQVVVDRLREHDLIKRGSPYELTDRARLLLGDWD